MRQRDGQREKERKREGRGAGRGGVFTFATDAKSLATTETYLPGRHDHST